MRSHHCLNEDEKSHLNVLTEKIIGLAIEIHKVLGPGLLEPTYASALCIEFDAAGIRYERQLRVPALYKGHLIGEYRIDFLVQDLVIVEVKSVERMPPVFEAQVLTYLRVLEKPVGLLINFNSRLLTEGVKRFVL
jgi:GxxExxY protein